MDAPAVVVDDDPAWPRELARIRRFVEPALVEGAGVEHVGSTAVPGLAAKPIIDVDVDVVVPRAGAVPSTVVRLARLGDAHSGDLGVAGREAFTMPPADLPFHHLYGVVRDRAPHRDHVDLHDFLRARPGAARPRAEPAPTRDGGLRRRSRGARGRPGRRGARPLGPRTRLAA